MTSIPPTLIHATKASPEIESIISDMFTYHAWDTDKVSRGQKIREVLMLAVRTIIENVPPSADRSAAIRKLREARMDCNSAITHNGKY